MENMHYVTLVETMILSLVSIVLSLIEIYKLKEYLAYNEKSNKGGKGLRVRSGYDEYGLEMMDKDQRSLMMKNLLGNVKKNQGFFLNNKLDDLLALFGDRKCKSCIELSTGWDKVQDPRKIVTWPLTPDRIKEYDEDYKFTKDDMFGNHDDNVYAEAKQKPEVISEAVQGDQGQQDFMRQLQRKHGDLLAGGESEDELNTRKKQGKRRGRKNKYYSAIDAEDDIEAEANEPSINEDEDIEDNMEIIKEQEQEEEILKRKVEEERLKYEQQQAERKRKFAEAEKARLEAEKAEEEERQRLEKEEEDLRLAQ